MQLLKFQYSSAGKVVQVGQGALAYWAFVPHPLPPAIQPDQRLWLALSEADRALGELAGLGRTLPNPHLLINPFIRREAVLSSRIEGTQTDVADLYAYETGQLPLPGLEWSVPESDMREVLNYVWAMEYGLQRLGTLPVSLRLIRELHERLMAGVRGEHATPGEFRHSQNWIGPPGCTLNEAAFVPPPVPQMQEALAALETYLHSDDSHPPLVRLAFIHYQFEAIHPFVDGNGRIGRLLLSLLMVSWNLLSLPLLYPSAYFEHHRQAYYERLQAVSEQGDWEAWLQYFLQGITEQSRDAITRVQRLQDLQITWRQRLSGARSASLLRLADSLFASPVLTIPRAGEILQVAYPTAQRNIERLVAVGILKQIGESSYGKTYVAEEILQAIQ